MEQALTKLTVKILFDDSTGLDEWTIICQRSRNDGYCI